MDRRVLAVVLEPMKHELGLSDSELGLLSGVAFAVVYATMGIPLGRLADRTNRTRLLAVCLGFWSIMTFTTGLARNFTQVFMARVGGGFIMVPAMIFLLGMGTQELGRASGRERVCRYG